MFISQEKLEKLIDGRINERGLNLAIIKSFYETKLFNTITALEDYLGIHYEENITKGYVKNKRVGKKK